MKENMQHFQHIMLCYFKKGKNNWNAKKICAVYGEGAVTDWICRKQFAKFCATQVGRAVEVDSNQIETLIENNTQGIANTIKISKSIKLLVQMKNVSFILWKKTKWTFCPTQYFSSYLGICSNVFALLSVLFLNDFSPLPTHTFFNFIINFIDLDILSMLASSHYYLLVGRGQGCC